MPTTTISLDDIQEGMVLGEDVSTPSGRLLLTAGTGLTDRHIQLLAANGITHVHIGGPAPTGNAPPAMSAGQIETHLQTRFEHNDDGHPLIDELKRICRQRLAGVSEGGDNNGNGTG